MANGLFRWVAALAAAACPGMAMPTSGLAVGIVSVVSPRLQSSDGFSLGVIAPPVFEEVVSLCPLTDDDRRREHVRHHVESALFGARQVPHVPVNRPLRYVKRPMFSHGMEGIKVPTWSQEQLANVRAIAQVGRQVGASQRDILIGIMTAMQESGLRNLNYGDRDSIGLFQQRNAWGSREQRLDPLQSARMFFLGGHQGQRGLLSFNNRDSMSLTQAAQKVQVSAFPDAYAKWENEANDLMKSIGETNTNILGGEPGGTGGEPGPGELPQTGPGQVVKQNGDLDLFAASGIESPNAPGVADSNGVEAASATGIEAGDEMPDFMSPITIFDGMDSTTPSGGSTFEELFPKQGTVGGSRERVGQLARQLLGTPYMWGGTDPDKGLDCSGFVQYVMRQVGVNLPRVSAAQANAGPRVGLGQLQAGDLVAWDNNARNNGADHIAIYLGNGQIIEAPRPGLGVRIRTLDDDEDAWGVSLNY